MSDDNRDSVEVVLDGVCAVLHLICMPFLILWHAYVACTIWKWFIDPRFHLGPLTIGAAIGIDAILSIWTFRTSKAGDDPDGKEFLRRIVYSAITPAWILLVAFIFHLFI